MRGYRMYVEGGDFNTPDLDLHPPPDRHLIKTQQGGDNRRQFLCRVQVGRLGVGGGGGGGGMGWTRNPTWYSHCPWPLSGLSPATPCRGSHTYTTTSPLWPDPVLTPFLCSRYPPHPKQRPLCTCLDMVRSFPWRWRRDAGPRSRRHPPFTPVVPQRTPSLPPPACWHKTTETDHTVRTKNPQRRHVNNGTWSTNC